MSNRLTRKIAKRAGSSIQYLEDEEGTVTIKYQIILSQSQP